MRVTISADSATTSQVRDLLSALVQVGLHGQAKVGLNGTEHWVVKTPPLTPNQFAQIACEVIKKDGTPVADILRGGRTWLSSLMDEEK